MEIFVTLLFKLFSLRNTRGNGQSAKTVNLLLNTRLFQLQKGNSELDWDVLVAKKNLYRSECLQPSTATDIIYFLGMCWI